MPLNCKRASEHWARGLFFFYASSLFKKYGPRGSYSSPSKHLLEPQDEAKIKPHLWPVCARIMLRAEEIGQIIVDPREAGIKGNHHPRQHPPPPWDCLLNPKSPWHDIRWWLAYLFSFLKTQNSCFTG